MTGFTRRAFGGLAAASGLAIATSATSVSAADAAQPRNNVPIERKPLDELYQDAVAEGGQLVVYAACDSPTQNEGTRAAFAQQFPGVQIAIRTDLSKYHDARIDNQLTRGRLEPDVAQLQTLQDFDRWKRQRELLAYKPAGWDAVYPQFKDAGGAYTGVFALGLGYLTNKALVPADQVPRSALDFLDPKYQGKLTITWPNDDDAVLFLFKKIIDRYGWSYLDRLLTQRPTFVRGLPTAIGAVSSGAAAATIAGIGGLAANPSSPTSYSLPTDDFFMSWAQTAAIFAKAKHPAAAKLYLNWLLSKPQQAVRQWSVRRDVPPPAGYRPLVEYRNTSHVAFRDFMTDRAGVERFKSQIELYVGAPQGPNPAGVYGPLLSPVG